MSEKARPCPTENELLARVAGTLPSERVALIDAHIDACSNCRMVLAEAARGADDLAVRPTALATFATDESVAGRYIVKRRIAVGGMGEVYEAHDTWLDELVAIKTIVPTIADNELALARLKAEIRLARRVTHKNVCRVYDLGFHQRGREQIAFLTMELVRGMTLRSRFEKQGPLEPSALIATVEQIVAALAHAHAEGIVHRDLKPDNVMLVESGEGTPARVVVMDFGLARMALVADTQPLTPNSHTVLGTLDYMSPEQVQGKHAGPASDIYSLGVMLYELLTGRLPFEAESPLARALLRVTQNPPSLADRLPEVDPAWSDCIARCLEREPKDRFRAIDEVTEALRPLGFGGHDSRRRLRTTRRRVTVAAIAAAGAALTVAVVGRHSDRSSSAPSPASSEPARPTNVAATATLPPSIPAPASPAQQPPAPTVVAAAPVPNPLPARRPASPMPRGVEVPADAEDTSPSAIGQSAETTDPGATAPAPREPTPQAPATGNALMDPFARSR